MREPTGSSRSFANRPPPRAASAADTLIAVLRANAISHQRDDIEPLRSSTGYDALSAGEKVLATERGKVFGSGLSRALP